MKMYSVQYLVTLEIAADDAGAAEDAGHEILVDEGFIIDEILAAREITK